MPITQILVDNAAKFGGDTALIEINPEARPKGEKWSDFALIETGAEATYRREITWSEFDRKSNKFANVLLSQGIGKGKKVAILLMNCIEWLPIYFGILKTGALVVPLNFRYTADEIKYCLKLAECQAIVFGPEFEVRMESIYEQLDWVDAGYYVGSSCPQSAQDYYLLTSNASEVAPNVSICDSDFAAIYFSSGTTGFPKAILHDHEALMSSCKTENMHHLQTKDDVFLCIPPLYHTGAKMHWFGSFLVGGKAVLLRGVKPEWILRTVSEERCTIVWLLVPWAQDILDAIERGDIKLSDYKLQQWRLMHIGAQPVPPSLIRRWKIYFPAHQYDTNYGLSESIGPGCVHLGLDNISKVGAIGKAGFGWQTMIADERGRPVKCGEVGELAVKGAGVMKCYYNDKEATDAILKDGWLFTGDMAREDEDGFIYLVDRKKDVIISGGENIYPVQIEDFLRAYPKIKDVAVIGLPDQRLGEVTCAIIEIKEGEVCGEDEINRFCSDLPRYKRPKTIVFDKVPRNPTGKIEKPVLRKKYCGKSLVETQIEG